MPSIPPEKGYAGRNEPGASQKRLCLLGDMLDVSCCGILKIKWCGTCVYIRVCMHTASSREDVIYVMERQKKILPGPNPKRILEFKQRWIKGAQPAGRGQQPQSDTSEV